MTTLYKVQKIEPKTTKAGKPYLLLTLNDKLVSFFDEKDAKVPVQEGQMITCRIVQKGNFLNGYDLVVTIESQNKAAAVGNQLVTPNNQPTSSPELVISALQPDNKIVAGKRIYQFDLKTASNGAKYIIINETFEDKKNSILIIEDHWKTFLAKLTEITTKK